MPAQVINILALAVGGNVTQGILKALARSPVPHRVVGADISPLQMGLFTVDRGYVGPAASAPAFREWLVKTCKAEGIDIILTGCEPILRVLSPIRAQVERATGATCLVNPPRIMDICEDKLTTCRWLEAQGFGYPHTANASDHEAVAALLDTYGFPLLAKPRVGGGAVGIYVVNSLDDLDYVCRKPGYLVQEMVGDDESEYTAGIFCDRHGAGQGTIVMWRALLAGTTYRAELGEFPEVRREAERIVAALKPIGPCNVQLRMTARGPVCFEINPRFSGTTPLRAYYGFNEAEAVLRHFVLDEARVELPIVTRGAALRYWNEIYVDPGAVEELRATNRLNDPHAHQHRVEDYGMDA